MKYIYLLLVQIFFMFNLLGQDAPDFTVTDSKGNTHHLYADYLDQGKTVVLKLFFIECPPCKSIAPLFEDLYQDWGGGNADVEFIELSTKTWNSNNNPSVLNYQNTFNLNFIGVGNTGGSLEASESYTSGGFGAYFGTPTFIVIAPNKSVAYDVSGAGNPGTITAIHQAIIATGATGVEESTPQTIFSVNMTYTTDMNNPVDAVYLQNGDGSNKVLLSSNSNTYSIAFPDDSLYPGITDPHLFLEKEEPAFKNLNIVDIIKLRKKALILEDFSNPLTFIAGDLDDNGSYNIVDIITLTRLALHLYDGLPNGKPMFRFINEACPDSDPQCFNGIPLALDPGTTQNIEIDIIKMGDISILE